jgi:hypothetical protein
MTGSIPSWGKAFSLLPKHDRVLRRIVGGKAKQKGATRKTKT